MFLTELHCRVALSALLFALALGFWGTVVFVRGGGVSPNYLGAIAIGEVLVVVEGLIGMALVVTGRWPMDSLHILYGVVTAMSWVATFLYTHGETRRREMGFYAIISFFVFGLLMRAVTTGATTTTCLPF